MRKFLCDYDSVWTLAELEQDFKEFAGKEFDGNFSQWLDECLGKNGALTEILTDETPKENRADAVSYYRVICSELAGDEYETWTTEEHADFLKSCGYTVNHAKKLGC